MATVQDSTGSMEAAIISRVIHADRADLPKDTAQSRPGHVQLRPGRP